MEDYSPISSAYTGPPVHGQVSGVMPKRKIRDRKRNKKNGRGRYWNKEDDIVLDKRLSNNLAEKGDTEARPEGGENPSEEEDLFHYGKNLFKRKRRNKVDVKI